VEFLGSIFDWIGTNESVLSGIAASIVIIGVLYVPIRALLRGRTDRGNSTDSPVETAVPEAPTSGDSVPSDIPSIAVMPFANVSGDPDQEFLADGLTEDIILGLSRVKQFFVIARNTCFTYKGTTADAQVVSQQLGVRYVLEGSVRKTGDRIRVTAQLVDARSRTQKWAERFDRKVEEILEVDDEVTEAIVTALQPALRGVEAEHARRAAPGDLTAWALVNQAWVSVQSDLGSTEAAKSAIAACERALALDPEYGFGHAVLAHATSLLADRPQQHFEELDARAMASINRALELAPDDGLVHHCHAALLGNLRRTPEARRAWERAVELDPNNAGAQAGLGISMVFNRQADGALDLIDGALRRSPADPLKYHWLSNRALALAVTDRIPEAIEVAEDSIQRKPSRLAYAVLAGCLACENRMDEAARAWFEVEAGFKNLDAEEFANMAAALAPDPKFGEVISAGLRRAGEAAKRLADGADE
jgi:adenylate cyclase